MEGIWKKAVILGAIGMILGIFVGAGFWYLLPHGAADASRGMGDLLGHLLLSGVIGMVANGSSVIYEMDEWSIARITITHFIISMGTVYIIAFTRGWFYPTDSMCWIMTAICVAAYFLIWLIMYLIYRHKVLRMNEELRKWKSIRRTE